MTWKKSAMAAFGGAFALVAAGFAFEAPPADPPVMTVYSSPT